MSSTMPETSSIGPVEAYWRYRAWSVPITIVIGLLAGLFALATSGTNTATTTLFLTDPRGTPVFRDGSSTPTDLARYARQRAEFADSAAVHNAVVASIDDLRDELSADPAVAAGDVPEAETTESIDEIVATGTTTTADVRIDCTADSEARALLVCDEVVAAYLVLTEQDISERADATIAAFLMERERLSSSRMAVRTRSTRSICRSPRSARRRHCWATVSSSSNPPRCRPTLAILPALQYTIAATLFAAFGVAIIAWFRAGRQPVITSSSDATTSLDAPLLGEVTEPPSQLFDPIDPPGAAYQLLATSLGAVHPTGGVLLTATAVPSTDAAETVARLAVAARARGSQRPADRRQPARPSPRADCSDSNKRLAGSPNSWRDSPRSTTSAGRSASAARRRSISSPAVDPSTTRRDCSDLRQLGPRCTRCATGTSWC